MIVYTSGLAGRMREQKAFFRVGPGSTFLCFILLILCLPLGFGRRVSLAPVETSERISIDCEDKHVGVMAVCGASYDSRLFVGTYIARPGGCW